MSEDHPNTAPKATLNEEPSSPPTKGGERGRVFHSIQEVRRAFFPSLCPSHGVKKPCDRCKRILALSQPDNGEADRG